MTREEILRYINLGRGKEICVDESVAPVLLDHIRRTYLSKGSKKSYRASIYFLHPTLDEIDATLTASLESDDLDELIERLEQYLNQPMETWENVNATGGQLKKLTGEYTEEARALTNEFFLKHWHVFVPPDFVQR
jgi:hypothetical protein